MLLNGVAVDLILNGKADGQTLSSAFLFFDELVRPKNGDFL
jgi:hypothetical protein